MSVCAECRERPRVRIAAGIIETADALGVAPLDLATAISYETAGSFDPRKRGPTTRQWGQHRGLIQFGEPQAKEYGVDWNDPIGSQLGPNGAVAKYLRKAGVRAGHGLLEIYSAINAGSVGRYSATDENNGGAPGTVRDKVNRMQRDGHRSNAERLLRLAKECSCLIRTSKNPTIILGDQDMTPCLRKAGLFAIRVYHNPPENVAPVLRPDYIALDQHWDIKWDRGLAATGATPKNKQEYAQQTGEASDGFEGTTIRDVETVRQDSGFYCLLASPKLATDPQGNPTCPPVLAYRGSEPQADELRGLALALRLRSEVLLRRRDGAGTLDDGSVLSRGTVFWPFHIGAGWDEVVAATESTEDLSGWAKVRESISGVGEALRDINATPTRLIRALWNHTELDVMPETTEDPADHNELLPAGLAEELAALDIPETQTVLHASGLTRQPPTTRLMRFAEDMMGGEIWTSYNAYLSLHYSEKGDWAANVMQAMGKVGAQYKSATQAVDDAIPEAQARGNRLNITGHSLGGGLAQAAALYCRNRYPDIRLGCQIFNASGLHENTAQQEADSTREDGLSVPIFSKQVSGELLTTAQTPGGFPLVWDIFRWQGVTIPDAIGVSDLRQGISPGPFPVGGEAESQFDFRTPVPAYEMAEGKDVPDGQLLPLVFPLAAQTRYKDPARHQVATGQTSGTGTTPTEDEAAELALLKYDNTGRMTFPHIQAIAGLATNAPDFQTFASETASYLMNALDEDTRDATLIDQISPLTDLMRMYAGARKTYDAFKVEVSRIGQLGGLSGAYHPMDIGGSTFLRPPKKEL